MLIETIADISPNGTAMQVAPEPALATWVAIGNPSTNAGDVRFGDLNVSGSRGAIVAKGQTVIVPRGNFDQQRYRLSTLYVYATGADKVSITYGD